MQPVLTPATNVKFSGSASVRDVLQLHVGDFISSLIRAVEILMNSLCSVGYGQWLMLICCEKSTAD